ncbi:hypothetical protein [Microbacterium sp.]|uniref:hypothetical protein n=1 Tax=Microbacterium sp. TaxID=51671 RepID=UPI002811D906|nr:hypothetical protein [Microbacterium sp.]
MQISPMWTDQDVLDAAAEWTWVPDGSRVSDGDVTLIQRPTWVRGHVAVERVSSARPAADLIDEASARARAWGDDALEWAVSERDDAAIARELQDRGAEVIERLDVLALPLTAEQVPATPPGVAVRRVDSRADVLAIGAINVAVWDNAHPDDARVEEVLAELHSGTGFRVVASLDGRAVATGGVTLAQGSRGMVARLWGAATIEEARGRGAYRAVLAERLRLAAEAGATLALVKGRVATSAPILKRAGFHRYGGERRFRLPL